MVSPCASGLPLFTCNPRPVLLRCSHSGNYSMRNNLWIVVIALLLAGTAAGQEVPDRGQPWGRHTIDDSSRGADGVRLADVNGDGHLDIASGWEEAGIVRLYLNPGPAKAQERWPAVTVGNVKSP